MGATEVQLMRLSCGPFPGSIRKKVLFIAGIINYEDAVSLQRQETVSPETKIPRKVHQKDGKGTESQ